jgi:hypothetical protein
MAKNQTVKIRPDILAKDLTDFAALKQITDYAPPNDAFKVTAIEADKTAMEAKAEALAQAEALVKTRRDELVAAEWKFHNSVEGGRDSCEAQYGEDSNEVQAVGRKKKSEYKNRTTTPNTGGSGNS